MKKFLALAAVVLGLASCQTEPEGFDVNVGGEQDVNITVSLPEGTRANSALGAFDNVDFTKYDVRFQCEVHYGAEKKVLEPQFSDNGKEASFNVRLIANRNYKFVVWADLVEEDSTADLHYNTSAGLHNITINDWNAMDETRDAFTCSEVREFTRNANIRLELKRPFAKLRVITTDIDELMGIVPTEAEVVYTTEYRNSFNAVEAKAGDVYATKTHNRFEIASYDETGTDKTLFADYLFASEGDVVNFSMNVYDQNGDLIDESKYFNTPIPVKRNYVTTIKGNILTYADDFTVTIKDAFDNADNLEEVPYHYAAVTNGVELIKALMQGREIIVLNNITVTAADLAEATRAGEAINPVIYLNGFTITVENNEAEALVDLNGGVLTVEGEGAIVSTTGALVETIYNVGEANIADNAATESVVNCLSDIRAAFANGGEYTMVCDLAISESLTLATGKELVFDLNGKTLTGTESSTGSFGLITNKGNLTVKDGTITLKAEKNREWNAYSSVISNNPGGNLVVENVTIEHFGGTDMAYGIDNLTNGKGTSAITNINEGAVVKSTYRAVRQFLNGVEATNELYVNAGAVIEGANKSIWMQDPSKNANTGKLVVNEGATLNGDVYLFVTAGSTMWPVEVSIAASTVNGEVLTGNVPAGYEVVEKDGVWTVVAYTKVANTDELIAALKACQPIILTDDITVTSKWDNRYTGAKTSEAITIDGNGNTLKFACEVNDGYNYSAAFRFEAPAVVKNLTIDMSEVAGSGSWLCAISAKSDITIDNCNIIGSSNYTSGRGVSFGEGAGAATSEIVVSVTNSTFTNWTRRGITDNENAQDAKSVTISNNVCTNAHVYVSAHDNIVFTGNTMENSAANFRSYTSAADATVVATGNTLDAALADYYIIRGFAAANVECQEGFTVVL